MRTRNKTIHKQFSIKFDEKMRNNVIELASEENISQAELVRRAVEKYISELKYAKQYNNAANRIINLVDEKLNK